MCCWGTKPTVVFKETCTTPLSPHPAVWRWQGKHGLTSQVHIQAAARVEGWSWNKNPVRFSPSNSKAPFRSHPSIGEIKAPRNMIRKSQHTPQETAYSKRKNSEGSSRHCKEKGYGAERHLVILQILPCPKPGAHEFCPPGNRRTKGTSFQISCCQNLNCAAQQPTKTDFSMHQYSLRSLLTW